ncbi:MAG: hypothetical protein BWK76_08165 [Desulfobulbaceae bacterium A2]|nr:MAG: hypothetical protein BWK76_08165 [Desulfobulbaceae bacterium A2]
MAQEPVPSERQWPEWVRQLLAGYYSGNFHQFLLDGNIRDLSLHPDPAQRSGTPILSNLDILVMALREVSQAEYILYYSPPGGLEILSRDNNFRPGSGKASQQESSDAKIFADAVLQRQEIANAPLDVLVRQVLGQIERALTTEWTRKDGDALKAIRIAVIIDTVERLIPADMNSQADIRFSCETLRSWAVHRGVAQQPARPLILLLSENRNLLPSEFRTEESGMRIIAVPRPAAAIREDYFTRIRDTAGDIGPLRDVLAQDAGPFQIAQLTRGFRLAECRTIVNISRSPQNIRDHFFRNFAAGEEIRGYLLSQVNDVIRSASQGMLEPMPPSISFDQIGGLNGAKDYFRIVAQAIQSDDTEHRKIIPKGVLLTGPPGTGKSVLAKALARETGINLVRMGNIRSMWVGESERNLSLVLDLLRVMAPVIVFVDEIDQALGARSANSGDSGVSGRIFQQILEFMGDNANRGGVIWIAATNRADLLDDALISRFDRIIPVLLPGSATEWTAVILGITRQLGLQVDETIVTSFVTKHLADLARHSGRSMETLLRLAYQRMLENNASQLTSEILDSTIQGFKTNINQYVYHMQTLLALAYCNDIRFITKPEDGGYSYGTELDPIVRQSLEERSNAPIDAYLASLRTSLAARSL